MIKIPPYYFLEQSVINRKLTFTLRRKTDKDKRDMILGFY